MSLSQGVVDSFRSHFGETPTALVRAPGRVNLIGEHTDYSDGFVLPMAIDRAIWIALRRRPDRRVRVHSLDFAQTAEFTLSDLARGRGPHWAEYVKGVAWALTGVGYEMVGWEGVLAGDVPIGAGLSSSAAVELAAARAFVWASRGSWEPATVARLAQRAENDWVGVSCGIMDQMISACAVAGHALLIDCRTLETRPMPLPPGTAVVVLDTNTRRGLVDSQYNERRRQCEAAARHMGASVLRDVDLGRLKAEYAGLDPIIARRARHVITENDRTLRAARAMECGDAEELGHLMDSSHASLRDDFEVSSGALDIIVDCARGQLGCYGARLTGAGFGGCAIALVHEETVEGFVSNVASRYARSTATEASVYVCAPAAGAELIEGREDSIRYW